jgi:hypothetical protein
MNLVRLDLSDERVQGFLWRHIEPGDFRWDYTRLDAMKEIESQVRDGMCQLWGDMDIPMVFRCSTPNPKVLEPHVMGDGRHLREGLRQGTEIAWGMGFELLRIWTQHEQIARIVEHCGFVRESILRKHWMSPAGELYDSHTLILERSDTCSI